MPKLTTIKECEKPLILKSNEFFFIWCCDCGLRHTYFPRIIRGDTPEEDTVEFFIERDDWATDAMKKLKKLFKKNKKKQKQGE